MLRSASVIATLVLVAACPSPNAPPPSSTTGSSTPAALPEPADEPAVQPDPAASPTPPAPSSEESRAAAAAINAFGIDLYGRLRDRRGNFALSPASIEIALAMTYAGARGDTAAEMARTLHLEGDADRAHTALAAQLRDWNAERSTYQLATANRIFAQQGVAWEQAFMALTRDRYAAPAEGVDFANDGEAARAHINRWTASQTNDRIQDLLPRGSITDLTRMVLVNAIYFKGRWLVQFDPAATSPGPFYVDGRAAAQVPLMRNTTNYAIARDADVQVLELPYAGEELSMLVVLPNARNGLAAVERSLSVAKIDAWVSALSGERVEVALPKLTIAGGDSLELKDPLKALGMQLAFDDRRADFTGIGRFRDDTLYISNVFHKAFVEVNEEGTEAAAASAVVMQVRGAGPAEARRFVADHPFLFLIRDRRSGAILFLGRVVDPRA